jgi:hypothetical protein
MKPWMDWAVVRVAANSSIDRMDTIEISDDDGAGLNEATD